MELRTQALSVPFCTDEAKLPRLLYEYIDVLRNPNLVFALTLEEVAKMPFSNFNNNT